MKLVVNSKISEKYRADLLVYCIDQKGKDKPNIPKTFINDSFNKACGLGDFKGEEGEVFMDYLEDDLSKNFKRVACFGIGKISKSQKKSEIREKMRKVGSKGAPTASAFKKAAKTAKKKAKKK